MSAEPGPPGQSEPEAAGGRSEPGTPGRSEPAAPGRSGAAAPPVFAPGPSGLAVASVGPLGAPVVLLVHGSMDRASSLRATARRLAADHHVLLYDRRGYGRSRAVGGPFDLATHVADLVAVLDGRPAVVFGHSLGGDVALAAAQRRPDLVRAVGAYEPPMSWEPWWPAVTAGSEAVDRAGVVPGPGDDEPVAAAAELFVRRMIGDALWERLPAATRAERRAEGAALVGELTDVRRAAPYDPDRISTPVLLACGGAGAAHHRQAAAVLRQRFVDRPERPVVVIEVPGARHGIHLEQPQALADLVRRLEALRVP